jgi:hypothetical protein
MSILPIIQNLASQVDAQTSECLSDIVGRNFLEVYFGTKDNQSESLEATRADMMCIGEDAHPAYFLIAARVLFRNRLLDIFADSLDVPRHPGLACVHRFPKPAGTVPRLELVCVFHS